MIFVQNIHIFNCKTILSVFSFYKTLHSIVRTCLFFIHCQNTSDVTGNRKEC